MGASDDIPSLCPSPILNPSPIPIPVEKLASSYIEEFSPVNSGSHYHSLQEVGAALDDDDGDVGDICRHCFNREPMNELIAPCSCSGSIKWVHRSCLNEWRAASRNPLSFTRCDVCHNDYIITKKEEERTCTKSKIALLILRDVLIFLLFIQAFLWILTGVLYLFDYHHEILQLFPQSWAEVAVYYLSAIIVALLLIGLCSTISFCFFICTCGKGCCNPVTHNTYHYNGWFFWDYYYACFIFPWIITPRQPVPRVAVASSVSSTSSSSSLGGCGDCCGSCDCGGGDGHICLIILLIIGAILVIIGLIVSTIFIVAVIFFIVQRHLSVLKKREDAQVDFVVDLSKVDIESI